MIGTSIALDLEPTKDDLLQGPLVVKSGEDPSISADIGLRLTPERFSLAVDMVIPGTEAESGSTDTTPKAHFDADIIAKRSDFSGKVTAPSSSKSFREFIDALDALAPAEGFTETPVPSVNDESGLEVHTTVSGSVQR